MRLATILGTAGARARSTSQPANGEQPRVFEDRFQRNGVILDQRHGVMATLLLLVEEEQRALLPPLKSLQQTRPGMVG